MDIRHLRYFTAVCEHRNVSYAASHCNVAQSAISSHIARLETELGVTLFRRKPRGMEPTAAGLRLYDHSKAILRSVEQVRDDLRSQATDLVGEIAVGMPFSVIKVIGAELMGTVMREHPGVKLVLSESLSAVLYSNFLDGEMELVVSHNPPPDSVTEREVLLEEELFCIGRPDLLGTNEVPILFDDIGQLPLALLKSGSLSRALADRTASFARLERQADLQLASVAATIAALEAGLACTIAPKVLVQEQLENGTLIARPVVEPTPTRTLMILSRTNTRPTRLRETLASLIRVLSHKAVVEGRWVAARIGAKN